MHGSLLWALAACSSSAPDPLPSSWRTVEHAVVRASSHRGVAVPESVEVEVGGLVLRGDVDGLRDLIRRGEPYRSAGCLPLVDLGLSQRDADPELARQLGQNLYLSSCPVRARLRALRLFCLAGPDACRPYVDDIARGRRDAAFRPAVQGLRPLLGRPVGG